MKCMLTAVWRSLLMITCASLPPFLFQVDDLIKSVRDARDEPEGFFKITFSRDGNGNDGAREKPPPKNLTDEIQAAADGGDRVGRSVAKLQVVAPKNDAPTPAPDSRVGQLVAKAVAKFESSTSIGASPPAPAWHPHPHPPGPPASRLQWQW